MSWEKESWIFIEINNNYIRQLIDALGISLRDLKLLVLQRAETLTQNTLSLLKQYLEKISYIERFLDSLEREIIEKVYPRVQNILSILKDFSEAS